MGDGVSSKEIIKPDFRSGEVETSMSILTDQNPGAVRLRQAADWLRDARAILTHSSVRVSGMSDKELRDIGLRPRSLSSTVYREIGKPGLVDFGWRLGR
jgi:hypothetical protein